MSLNLSQNIIFEKTIELLIEQLIELNKKIENIETKIDNLNVDKKEFIYLKICKKNMNEVDWNSIHLY